MIKGNGRDFEAALDRQRRVRNRLALALITAALAGTAVSTTMSNKAYAKVSNVAQMSVVQEIRLSDGTVFNYKSVDSEDIDKKLIQITEEVNKDFLEIQKNQDVYMAMLDQGYDQEDVGLAYRQEVDPIDERIRNKIKDVEGLAEFSSEVVFEDTDGNRMEPRDIKNSIGVVKDYLGHLNVLRGKWTNRINMQSAQINFDVHDGNVVQNIHAAIKTDRHSDYNSVDWQTFADRLSNLSESDVKIEIN